MRTRPAALLLLLAGCAPVMETALHFAPPAGEEGRQCVARCQADRAPCVQSCDRRERLCRSDAESRAMRDYNLEADRYNDARRSGSSRTYFDYADRYRRLCSFQGCRDTCVATYRGCFEACGGTVTETQVCVANCG
ncbi:hypothetical protein [Azospirillum sp. TSO22-1]|uniref:hypothetical protein n=1 Tax=Azospirillum sp. TSO22-1 TaxID=716789 RepID=UPI000D654572|nr:hypothetical protein [Azospirillum sp. TSO22-1]